MPKADIVPHRRFGWIRDQPDPRDFVYAGAAKDLSSPKPKVSLRLRMPPVFDQGQLGSCTTNSTCAMLEYNEGKKGQRKQRLSRLELYYRVREYEGTLPVDAGASIRDVLKVTFARGVAIEKLWPYDIEKQASIPPDVASSNDKFHRVIVYRQVLPNVAAMRACLSEGYPFVFGFPVYESFYDVSEKTWNPSVSEQIVGYHAVLCIGYDYSAGAAPRWEIRNSWGRDWGDAGHFWVPESFMLTQTFDRWTVRDIT